MCRNFFCFIWIFFVCLFAGCDSNKNGIAVVNSNRAMMESEAGRAGMAHLEKMGQKIQAEIDALQKGVDTALDKDAAQENYQDRLREVQQQFMAKQQEIVAVLEDRYTKALTDVRTEKNLGMVFEATSTAMRSYDENLDITGEVIAAMNKTPVEFPLPETPAGDEATPSETTPAPAETQDISE